ncbi:hypothetical protein AJ79_05676 [Helicocarpus griseus UAMH5409]|uniref:Secreted protein n=1 Tax=Helicocarpus griseus UAMH5409 TaxID=1447875 RepID=A0A2B7XL13_9EURO|nr:hypothetical protein AJ79_05676 [Helicocarpus griseus UAMH5409]
MKPTSTTSTSSLFQRLLALFITSLLFWTQTVSSSPIQQQWCKKPNPGLPHPHAAAAAPTTAKQTGRAHDRAAWTDQSAIACARSTIRNQTIV